MTRTAFRLARSRAAATSGPPDAADRPRWSRRPWQPSGLALAAGALLALSLPPRGWWFLAPLGIALLALALRGTGWPGRLGAGALAGTAFFGPSLLWLVAFSRPGYAVAVMLEAALFAAAVLLVPRDARGLWVLPAALVLLEAVRTRFPFGGFPIPSVALSQLDGPVSSVAPVGGALLVVAVTAAAGVSLSALATARYRFTVLFAAATVGVPLTVGALVPATRPAGELRASVVQGGGPRGIPAVFTDPSEVTERHFAVSERLQLGQDLVLWPEDVVDIERPLKGSAVAGRLAALARRVGATLVVGVVEDTGTGFRNAAVAWTPTGGIGGRYEKVHRVPFGEYIPAREIFERLSDATALVPRDAIAGRGPGILRTPAGSLGVVISYEVFFADRARAAIRAGGQVLLVPTNAASYTTPDVPATEIAAARLRALEMGRAVLQAAPTGYSAVIEPDGRVTRMSALGAAALLEATVPLRDGYTPYARTGDTPMVLLSVFAVAAGLLWGRRRLSRHWGRVGGAATTPAPATDLRTPTGDPGGGSEPESLAPNAGLTWILGVRDANPVGFCDARVGGRLRWQCGAAPVKFGGGADRSAARDCAAERRPDGGGPNADTAEKLQR